MVPLELHSFDSFVVVVVSSYLVDMYTISPHIPCKSTKSHSIHGCQPSPTASPIPSGRRRRHTLINDLPLKNSLLVPRPRRQLFPRSLPLGSDLSLPLDLADAVAAVAFDIFGELDEVEDVFLFGAKGKTGLEGGEGRIGEELGLVAGREGEEREGGLT